MIRESRGDWVGDPGAPEPRVLPGRLYLLAPIDDVSLRLRVGHAVHPFAMSSPMGMSPAATKPAQRAKATG